MISVRHPTLYEDTAALLLDPLQKYQINISPFRCFYLHKVVVTYIIVELFLNHFQSRRTLSSSFLDCLPWSVNKYQSIRVIQMQQTRLHKSLLPCRFPRQTG